MSSFPDPFTDSKTYLRAKLIFKKLPLPHEAAPLQNKHCVQLTGGTSRLMSFITSLNQPQGFFDEVMLNV